MTAHENLHPDQFGPPAPGSKWTNTKTGKPAKVIGVTTQPVLDLEANTLSQGNHRVWIEQPHPQKRHRTQTYDLEGFHKQHTRAED